MVYCMDIFPEVLKLECGQIGKVQIKNDLNSLNVDFTAIV